MTTTRLLCLVTDRRRLAAGWGRCGSEATSLLLRQIEGAVAGRIDLVQVRERDLEGRALVSLVREAVAIAAGSMTRVIVNDRVDVALSAGAAGVHLPEHAPFAEQIRHIAPRLTIGRSVHAVPSADATIAVDYLIAGTVFHTRSKAAIATLVGLEGFRAVVQAAKPLPVLAIGGVTEATAASVARAGAAGLAAIGAFLPPPNVQNVVKFVEERAEILRFAFDTDSAVS